MASEKSITPEVTWAQRSSSSDASKNYIYITINAPDVDKSALHLDLQPSSVHFKGYSNSKKATYEVTLDLFGEFDKEASKISHSARDLEMKLQKKELNAEYWPRLLKDKAKVHFLKTDFDKWVDEDEQDAVAEDDPMGAFGGGGMPGMGGDGGFGGLDFSKLGGLGGAGGMGGMAGMPEMGDDDLPEDDDDEDMPELEDEEAEAGSSAAGKSKIEEVE